MTTLTPYLSLVLYNSTTDQTALFSTFRADLAGDAVTSNFYKIDTAFGSLDSRLDILESVRAGILVNASFISPSYYEATVTAITAYTTGMSIILKLDTDSAGAVTLKINALSTLSLMKCNAAGSYVNITGAELQAGRYYLFVYDGTRWVWVDASSADQVHHGGTAGNVVLVAADGSISDSTTPGALVAGATNGASSKATPVDADEIPLTDSAASFALKKLTWANLKATLDAVYKWATVTFNASTKATPVNADLFSLVDTEASNVIKKISFSELKTALGASFLSASANNLPEGTVVNGQFVTSAVSSNLKLELKTLAGNDPSSGDPVYVRIGNTIRSITAALSVTLNAGTNWFSSGSTVTSGKEIDYFIYLGYNATDGVVIGFSRIAYGAKYGDFSGTTSLPRYGAISTITNAVSTDRYVLVGRFNATLTTTNWSIPATSVIINAPINYSRWLSWTPVWAPNVGTWSASTEYARYMIRDNQAFFEASGIAGISGSAPTILSVQLPFSVEDSYNHATKSQFISSSIPAYSSYNAFDYVYLTTTSTFSIGASRQFLLSADMKM